MCKFPGCDSQFTTKEALMTHCSESNHILASKSNPIFKYSCLLSLLHMPFRPAQPESPVASHKVPRDSKTKVGVGAIMSIYLL